MKKIAIIDGDSLAYRAAAATEDRSVMIQHLPSGREKVFKTRTEFKDSLKAKNFEFVPEDYKFIDIQDPEPETNAFHIVKLQIDKIYKSLKPDEVRIYIAGGDNFRNFLALPTPYKPRGDMLRPVNLLSVRNHLVNRFEAQDVSASFLETDDVVTIDSYSELAKGNSPVLCSLDKDSGQSDGIYLFDWTKENPTEVLVPLIGELRKEKNAVKGIGLKFLCLQWLAGDKTDGYCGYDLSNVKYGPTKAMKALVDCKTTQELYDTVVSEFQKLYPEPFEYVTWNGLKVKADFRDMMSLYWSCAYMKRSWDDKSDYLEFWKSKGVTC